MKVNDDIIDSDYTIKVFSDLRNQHTISAGVISGLPFRVMCPGPINIRKQSTSKAYKTFLGEQEN